MAGGDPQVGQVLRSQRSSSRHAAKDVTTGARCRGHRGPAEVAEKARGGRARASPRRGESPRRGRRGAGGAQLLAQRGDVRRELSARGIRGQALDEREDGAPAGLEVHLGVEASEERHARLEVRGVVLPVGHARRVGRARGRRRPPPRRRGVRRAAGRDARPARPRGSIGSMRFAALALRQHRADDARRARRGRSSRR